MRLCEFPGGRRQAERRKSQGATLASRLCEFPGLKPLAGFGAEPQAGFGTAVPTSPRFPVPRWKNLGKVFFSGMISPRRFVFMV